MKTQLFRLAFLLICLTLPLTATAQVVDIPDPNLRAAIETTLGKAAGDTITVTDMERLTKLNARDAKISDLTGLEHGINLTELDLAVNSLSDLSSLLGLTNLTTLNLALNSLSDLSALSGLTNLTELNLFGNSISDLSSLSGLTNLTYLDLTVNSISDLSSLSGLTNLIVLGLSSNDILDLSSLSGLTNLIHLDLRDNYISDLSSLSGLTNLTYLGLATNDISNLSSLSGLTNLTYLGLATNSISDLSSLSGLTDLTELNLFGNIISDLSPLISNTGLGTGDSVDVRDNPLNAVSVNTHIPTLQSRGVTVEFDAVVVQTVNLPDAVLRAVIEQALGKPPGAEITVDDMATLTRFEANNVISDLTGLEHAKNLTVLNLSFTRISDLSAVSGLTNLTELYLSSNSLSDISAMAGLTNLTKLHLDTNSISDISALSGLTSLAILGLSSNSISDISALSGLTNLTYLNLGLNSLSDLSSLSGLTNLIELNLSSNSISDISALSGLTSLAILGLSSNSISDISALAANTGLGSGDTVYVRGNPLNAVSVNTHIPALQSRRVTVQFDNQAHSALLKISGDNQNFAISTPLSEPFIVEAQDENGAALEGISVTFTVTAGGGSLSVENTTTNANGRAESILTLGPSLGTNTVEVSAEGVEATVTFNAISDTESPTSVEPTDQLAVIMLGGIKRTALFQNYPNPFNPETWIPYHLASDADVQLTIYDALGAVVRQFDLGHQTEGYYTNRTKAVYWDGRNHAGEPVGSGIYFYQLTADDYSATRKMVILK